MTTVTMIIGKPATSVPQSKEHFEDSAEFRDREIDPGCRSKQEDVTAGEEVIQNNTPKRRQLTVQISDTRYWGYLPEILVRGTIRQKIGQPFLGSVPLVPLSQILAGCLKRWRLPDWSCYSNTNSLAQTEIKWAAHQRLLDWSWSQQNREKPIGQLTGDCLTGLGPNRTGKNQKGSSAETA